MAWIEEKDLSRLLLHCFPLRRKKLLFLNNEKADELVRVGPERQAFTADGCLYVIMGLWATPHRFRRYHQICLQVSSGLIHATHEISAAASHLALATKLLFADLSIYHDPDHQDSR
jgi:hypothetical protein